MLQPRPRRTFLRELCAVSSAAAVMLCGLVAFVLYPTIPQSIHQAVLAPGTPPAGTDGDAAAPVTVVARSAVADAVQPADRALPVVTPATGGQDEFVRELARTFYTRAAPTPAKVREQRISEYRMSNGDTLLLLHQPVQRVSYSPPL